MLQRGGGIELLSCYNLGLKEVFWHVEDTLPHLLSSPHTQDCTPRVFSVVCVGVERNTPAISFLETHVTHMEGLVARKLL